RVWGTVREASSSTSTPRGSWPVVGGDVEGGLGSGLLLGYPTITPRPTMRATAIAPIRSQARREDLVCCSDIALALPTAHGRWPRCQRFPCELTFRPSHLATFPLLDATPPSMGRSSWAEGAEPSS